MIAQCQMSFLTDVRVSMLLAHMNCCFHWNSFPLPKRWTLCLLL